MKKIMILFLLIVLSVSIVSSKEIFQVDVGEFPSLVKVGDVSEKDVEIVDVITYTEVKDAELIGFEQISVYEDVTYETCNYTDEPDNLTLDSCENNSVSEFSHSIDGDKIIEYSYVKSIRYNSDTYDFVSEKCWVCGIYIGCLDVNDGGSNIHDRAEEFKCDGNNKPIIRDGEKGFVKNLQTGEITEQVSGR